MKLEAEIIEFFFIKFGQTFLVVYSQATLPLQALTMIEFFRLTLNRILPFVLSFKVTWLWFLFPSPES